jgi:hypothetical protein
MLVMVCGKNRKGLFYEMIFAEMSVTVFVG